VIGLAPGPPTSCRDGHREIGVAEEWDQPARSPLRCAHETGKDGRFGRGRHRRRGVGHHAIRSSQAPPSKDTRLVVSYTGQSVGDDNLVFVQDAKTGACWLAAYGASGGSHSIALALAPAESCQ
jgi:hypothetical protein